jgi:prepilin-type N-terminal cleavage/methylation domain-containing protein
MKLRRAFTLIELLVVIAIIAILAAILFPVFAQAKLAAKASASLSNTKQIALGIIMYSNDYDDMWPMSMAFNESNAAYYVGSHGISPWSYTIFPYIKTAAIYMDPVAGNNDNGYTGGDLSVWEAYNSEYGYNWTLLNGGFDNVLPGQFGIGSTESTSISRPSDMVMVTTTTLHTDQNYADYFYDFQFSTNPYEETYGSVLGVVEGPYCDYQTTGCNDLSSYWGISNGWGNLGPGNSSPTQNPQLYIEGAATSGNAMRDNGLVVTSFTDGHSKALTIGALSVGTNWNPTFTKSQVQLTNKDTYRWWQY